MKNRVADLQMSYDELNGALVSAEDRFKATADTLAAKQNAISGFLNRAGQVEASVGARAHWARARQLRPSPRRLRLCRRAADVDAPAGDAGSSALIVMPGPAQPQPRTGRATHAACWTMPCSASPPCSRR